MEIEFLNSPLNKSNSYNLHGAGLVVCAQDFTLKLAAVVFLDFFFPKS